VRRAQREKLPKEKRRNIKENVSDVAVFAERKKKR
jgi:hypothetical protein